MLFDELARQLHHFAKAGVVFGFGARRRFGFVLHKRCHRVFIKLASDPFTIKRAHYWSVMTGISCCSLFQTCGYAIFGFIRQDMFSRFQRQLFAIVKIEVLPVFLGDGQ